MRQWAVLDGKQLCEENFRFWQLTGKDGSSFATLYCTGQSTKGTSLQWTLNLDHALLVYAVRWDP